MEFAVLDGGGKVATRRELLAVVGRGGGGRHRWRAADISRQEVRRGIGVFRVLPARPDVHRVVRILVEIAERGIVDVAAAEIPEVVEAQDLLHVLRSRVMIMDLLVDGLSVFVFGRVAQRIPQRIRHH